MIMTKEAAMQKAYATIRRQVLNEVMDAIADKQMAIRTLLNNGLPILVTSDGDRYVRLATKRKRLWIRLLYLNDTWDMVYNMQ